MCLVESGEVSQSWGLGVGGSCESLGQKVQEEVRVECVGGARSPGFCTSLNLAGDEKCIWLFN